MWSPSKSSFKHSGNPRNAHTDTDTDTLSIERSWSRVFASIRVMQPEYKLDHIDVVTSSGLLSTIVRYFTTPIHPKSRSSFWPGPNFTASVEKGTLFLAGPSMSRTRPQTRVIRSMLNFDHTPEHFLASFDVLEYKLAGFKILVNKPVHCVQPASDSILGEHRDAEAIFPTDSDWSVGGCEVIKRGFVLPLTSRRNLKFIRPEKRTVRTVHLDFFDGPGFTTFGYKVQRGLVTSIENITPKTTSVSAGKLSFLLKEIRQAAERSGNGRCQVRFDVTDGGSFHISLLQDEQESLPEDIRRLFWSNGKNGKDRGGSTGDLSGGQQIPPQSTLKQEQEQAEA